MNREGICKGDMVACAIDQTFQRVKEGERHLQREDGDELLPQGTGEAERPRQTAVREVVFSRVASHNYLLTAHVRARRATFGLFMYPI